MDVVKLKEEQLLPSIEEVWKEVTFGGEECKNFQCYLEGIYNKLKESYSLNDTLIGFDDPKKFAEFIEKILTMLVKGFTPEY